MWKSRFWLGIRILKNMSPKALLQCFFSYQSKWQLDVFFAPFWLTNPQNLFKCGSNLLAPNLSESHSHSFRQQRPNQPNQWLLLVPFLIYIIADQGNHHALSCGWPAVWNRFDGSCQERLLNCQEKLGKDRFNMYKNGVQHVSKCARWFLFKGYFRQKWAIIGASSCVSPCWMTAGCFRHHFLFQRNRGFKK